MTLGVSRHHSAIGNSLVELHRQLGCDDVSSPRSYLAQEIDPFYVRDLSDTPLRSLSRGSRLV